MRRHGDRAIGIGCAAFGIGLLVAVLCSARFLLVLMAAALIVIGMSVLNQ